MLSSAKQLRQKGANDLKGRWGEAALLTFVYGLLAAIFSSIFGTLFGLLIPFVGSFIASLLLMPMGWGFYMTFLANHRKEDNDPFSISHLFDGYRDFARIFTTYLLVFIYTFLWSLLLIIPGIIKTLSYAMTRFILRDRPDLKNNEAIELSMAMMDGYKGKLFWLYLTFIGWAILCIFTLGIGYFWVGPYVYSTVANFYEEVKAEYEGKGSEKPAEVDEGTYNKSER